MPVIILGGIYGGIFTPTEAAAVSVVYGLFVGMVIYREVKLKDLFDILVDSAKTTGGIMLIVASASLFSFVCTKFGIANAASELLASIAHNQFTFLLIVNIIFLIAGCFIDANSAMYIFVPIMLPVCKALGYDVVAFGVMATVNLAIGQVTPPVGVNLFVAISIKIKKGLEVTLQQISRAVMPMIVASVAVLLIITYIPAVSTALPKALAKEGSYTGDQSSDTGSQSSKDAGDGSDSFNTIADYSDLDWPEMTWNFACSTTETSTWADGGRKFGELMEKATGGKVKVNIYAADQLTNGNQSEGIQALMNGDPVQIKGIDNQRAGEQTKRLIGVVFQDSVLDKPLTVKENLKSRAALYGITGKAFEKRLQELLDILDFGDYLNRPVGKLSGGQRRRIDIARALLHRPEILILDEPTTGLDPQTRQVIWNVIEKLRIEEQMTVFLTTHYMEEAANAAYVVILDKGSIVAEGTPYELKNRYVQDTISVYGVTEAQIKSLHYNYKKVRDGYQIKVDNTSEATKLIVEHQELFQDYEVVKGGMDDVFLAVTGKTLGGGRE